MGPALIQVPWSKLLTQDDGGWSEYDVNPLLQWTEKNNLADMEKEILTEVIALLTDICKDVT